MEMTAIYFGKWNWAGFSIELSYKLPKRCGGAAGGQFHPPEITLNNFFSVVSINWRIFCFVHDSRNNPDSEVDPTSPSSIGG
jgi:hypothetical protein